MFHHVYGCAAVAIAVLLSTALSQPATGQDALVIQNVNVIDVERGEVVPNQTIIIRDGSIRLED